MSFFEEVAIDDSFLKVKGRQTPFFIMIDVNKKFIKIHLVLFRFWELEILLSILKRRSFMLINLLGSLKE